jgi:uncharacterized protein (UPF0276 family)
MFNQSQYKIQGVGLGLKRELIPQIQAAFGDDSIRNINFVEIAPENWIEIGGKAAKQLDWLSHCLSRFMPLAWWISSARYSLHKPS